MTSQQQYIIDKVHRNSTLFLDKEGPFPPTFANPKMIINNVLEPAYYTHFTPSLSTIQQLIDYGKEFVINSSNGMFRINGPQIAGDLASRINMQTCNQLLTTTDTSTLILLKQDFKSILDTDTKLPQRISSTIHCLGNFKTDGIDNQHSAPVLQAYTYALRGLITYVQAFRAVGPGNQTQAMLTQTSQAVFPTDINNFSPTTLTIPPDLPGYQRTVELANQFKQLTLNPILAIPIGAVRFLDRFDNHVTAVASATQLFQVAIGIPPIQIRAKIARFYFAVLLAQGHQDEFKQQYPPINHPTIWGYIFRTKNVELRYKLLCLKIRFEFQNATIEPWIREVASQHGAFMTPQDYPIQDLLKIYSVSANTWNKCSFIRGCVNDGIFCPSGEGNAAQLSRHDVTQRRVYTYGVLGAEIAFAQILDFGSYVVRGEDFIYPPGRPPDENPFCISGQKT